MSLINLTSLVVLALVLTVGLLVHRRLKRYLKNIDGLVGVTSQNEMERSDWYLRRKEKGSDEV